MAWLSRVNFISSDTLSFTDVNNLGNDIRAWGDNVNGGGYTLSNVVLSATSGTMATIIGGTGTTSTLTLRSTSGVGTTGADIIFQAGNNGATEVMRLQNGGNVLVGTTSSGFNAAALPLVVGSGSGNNGITIFSGSTTSGSIHFADTVTTGTGSYSGYINYNHNTNSMQFATDALERMRIDSGGNVSIAVNKYISFNNSDTNSRIQVNAGSGFMEYRGYSGHIFYDTATNSERMRINSGGNVLIGYTTSNGSYLLQVNSQIFATNATIATSDGRYKQNISPISSGLDVIGKLKPVSFNWKPHEIHNFDSGTQVGFIAQDVQEALAGQPYLDSVVKRNHTELKDGTKEEFYGLSDSKLIPLLVKAIQELKAEIDILKARN